MFGDAVIGPAVMMFAFMPAVVLTSKLVPKGLESTTYALLAGFQNFGGVVSSQIGIYATQVRCECCGMLAKMDCRLKRGAHGSRSVGQIHSHWVKGPCKRISVSFFTSFVRDSFRSLRKKVDLVYRRLWKNLLIICLVLCRTPEWRAWLSAKEKLFTGHIPSVAV